MPIISAFIQGIVLGLGIAAPFGPINVEIIRRHLGQGMAAGLLLGLGACSVDTAYILLVSFGLITVQPGPAVQLGLTLAGSAILLLLAGLIIRSAGASAKLVSTAGVNSDRPSGRWRHYATGVAMTAASPMNLVFWFGVIVSGSHRVDNPLGYWPTVAGVMTGTVSWVFGLNLALIAGRKLLRPRILLAINLLSAALLAGIAIWSIAVVL